MLATLARGSVLLFLATMLVAWALSLGKAENTQPQSDQVVERLYS
jgi:hypothetical protein